MRTEQVIGYFWLRRGGVVFSRIMELTDLTANQCSFIESCKQPKVPYCIRQMTEIALRWEHKGEKV